MAEYPILGKTIFKRLFERVDVVYALADERAFAQQILIDVGNRARIRVDPRFTRSEPLIFRQPSTRQGHAHTRLQDAISLNDTLFVFVVVWSIQGMIHGGYTLPRRIPR